MLHYSVQNPQPREVRYHWSDLSFTAVDAQDRNHTFVQTVARQGAREALSTSLKPAQKVNVTTVILVPAAGPVRKLLVSREAGAPILRYDLRGQVAPLVAPFADASDPSGSTPLAQVRVPAGTFLPLGWLDVRLDEVGFTAEPLAGRAPATGKRYLTAVFTLKNMGPRDTRYHWGDFKPGLKDAEGEHLGYNEQMLRASRDEKANGMLPSGEETRVRFFWELPGNVGADTLYLNDRQGLTYAFVVKDAR